jgi:hypothetical protein
MGRLNAGAGGVLAAGVAGVGAAFGLTAAFAGGTAGVAVATGGRVGAAGTGAVAPNGLAAGGVGVGAVCGCGCTNPANGLMTCCACMPDTGQTSPSAKTKGAGLKQREENIEVMGAVLVELDRAYWTGGAGSATAAASKCRA